MALTYDPKKAMRLLSKNDPKLGELIKQVGPVDIDPPKRLNPFEALLRSIIYQQLSGKAAATIHGRVRALFPGRTIKPNEVLAIADQKLRDAGMSWGKITAANDLAHKTVEGVVPTGAKLRNRLSIRAWKHGQNLLTPRMLQQ